jgi:hypothetical protein
MSKSEDAYESRTHEVPASVALDRYLGKKDCLQEVARISRMEQGRWASKLTRMNSCESRNLCSLLLHPE